MAVAMAGRAIKPSLDVLQQLVKSQRENVAEVIEQEQRQIDQLKSSLDEIVRENEDLESECISMEAKVELVLSNHRMVHESLCKYYGFQRIELMPGMSGSTFQKGQYEKMISILYEEPQYLSVMLRRPSRTRSIGWSRSSATVFMRTITRRGTVLYALAHYARDGRGYEQHHGAYEYPLPSELRDEDDGGIHSARAQHGGVKGGPLQAVIISTRAKKLELEIDPSRVYVANLDYLRFKIDPDLESERSPQEAWKLKEVRDIVLPRVKNLLEIVDVFLTRVIAARGILPYGVRAIARKVYEMAQVRQHSKATAGSRRSHSSRS